MFRATFLLSLLALSAVPLAAPAAAAALELAPCRINAGPSFPSIKARCGTIERPLDPGDPGLLTIELRIAVVPALNLTPLPDPVVPLAGGPGQGAVQLYAAYAPAFEDLRRDRNILLVDQRGTGASSPMNCPFDESLVEGRFSVEVTREATEACLQQLPHDPRFFTTSVAVTDLEAVRQALGYPALNLYGISYGTRVAQHYARRYPETTRSIVLDGVVPPQISLGPEIATESQRALDKIFARCAADEGCGARFPEVAASFKKLVGALRESPVTVAAPHPNTGRVEQLTFGSNELSAAVRLLAYHPNTVALLPLLVHEAANGNFVPLASQYQLTALTFADTLALGMHNSIMCSEDVPFYDSTLINYDGLVESYMGIIQLEAIAAICSAWPVGPVDDEFKVPLATSLPVLLLSGDADPITPPRYAEMAAVDLQNALHLVGSQQGHGQLAVGCTRRLVADFVAAADSSGIDAACLERSFVMPFFVDFSGPLP
ncbi:MAG: alpha/beta hydrolase [Gammaproteobacteria bacterium]|nr:alpha/beta hydrolase [Gammaproteobacteria bacterium]